MRKRYYSLLVILIVMLSVATIVGWWLWPDRISEEAPDGATLVRKGGVDRWDSKALSKYISTLSLVSMLGQEILSS